ncbi:MAG: hypothetical protein NVSMB56_15260 [Pyrinomonadaceae bacterium]
MGLLLASPETFNRRQKRNRVAEWRAVESFIASPVSGKFLDVGCGTGYALARAKQLGFEVVGIDPESGTYGVRDKATHEIRTRIVAGAAEKIPFADKTFQVVYSSHAIEHFNDQEAGLAEIARVLHPQGIAVLVVPTGTAAFIRTVSLYLFNTHRSIGKFLLKERTSDALKHIFLPPPHGSEAAFAHQEMRTFSIARWHALFAKYFMIESVVVPCLYPWPDFPQFFPLVKLKRFGSSVVFVCRTKMNDGDERLKFRE